MNESTLIQLLQMAPSRPSEVEERIWTENFCKDYPRPVPVLSNKEFEARREAHIAAHAAYFNANKHEFHTDAPTKNSVFHAMAANSKKDPAMAAWERWQTECWELYKRDFKVNWAKAQFALLQS